MPRRRGRKKRTRRRAKPLIKIVPTVAGIIGANGVLKATMGTELMPFLLDGWARPKTDATNNSDEVSLYELFMPPAGQQNYSFDGSKGLTAVIKRNFQAHLPTLVSSVVIATVIPKIASKTGLVRNGNKAIRAMGMEKLVAF
jgi:hypothetical protein